MCHRTPVGALRQRDAQVSAYIPDRFDEGYGLNTAALETIRAQGAQLLITVDCGIRSYDEVAQASASGLDIIITDHHSAPDTLPPACAVVDPKRSDSRYPFGELSGTGVAFRLAQALLGAGADAYLDLVAVATVADIVPLVDENRLLVRGPRAPARQPRPGLAALMQVPVSPQAVNSIDIASAGAALNAAGLANAGLAALLASETLVELRPGQELDALNQQQEL